MAKVVNGMTVPQLSKQTNYDTNYDNWCLQMKTLPGSQSLWNIVEKGFKEPEENEDQSVTQIAALEKTQVKDKSALYFLYNVVDLKMEDKEQVIEYITQVEKVANQLGRNGEPMQASRIVEKILRSLTDDFKSITCAIEESKDLSVLSVEELTGSLEAHEQRRRKKKKDTFDQALQARFDENGTRNERRKRNLSLWGSFVR